MIKLADIQPYRVARFGTPYAGVCRLDPEGRLEIDKRAGRYQGSYTGGVLAVDARPGDVVAWGQDDYHGQRGFRLYGTVGPDGKVAEFDAEQLSERLGAKPVQTSVQKPPEPPAPAVDPNLTQANVLDPKPPFWQDPQAAETPGEDRDTQED